MTVDLSTMQARDVWDRAVYQVGVYQSLTEKFARAVETGKNELFRNLGPGTHELVEYRVIIGEDGSVEFEEME